MDGGVKESVADEKVRQTRKHGDDNDLNVANEGGYGYLFFNVALDSLYIGRQGRCVFLSCLNNK